MSTAADREPTPVDGVDNLIDQVAEHLGHAVPPEWQAALRAVPRHQFLPDRLWLRDGAGGYAVCDRVHEPHRWWAAAYSDMPLITQVISGDDTVVPTSSASAPGTVIRMLEHAQVADGMRVLEIGTGTGFHAALLAARLGEKNVTSVEIDAALVEQARANLRRAGRAPAVHHTDGALGWPPGAPYDRIIATCAVRSVPPAWLEQSRPGGRVVTPWDSAWCAFGTLTLTVSDDGSASDGSFAAFGSYMVMRGQRPDIELHRDVLRAGQEPRSSTTRLSPWEVAGQDLNAQFAIGLAVPGVWHSWDTTGQAAPTRLWLADDTGLSWAAVDYDGQQAQTFAVSQYGPRALWDEVAHAHQQWVTAGRPTVADHEAPVGTPRRG
ncbi:methyltransferase domain-containing protein [Streptomyces buecherae]|uniref:methyltransferase domain-containing protein n=1 Tax=Streptomyces buecherae TaxID=2763006 RepID=UPI00365B8057